MAEGSSAAGPSGRLIVVDWGTSSLRATLLESSSPRNPRKVLEVRSSPKGIGRAPSGEPPGRWLVAALQDITKGKAWELAPVVMCGMIGSRNGLVEVPYVSAPVDAKKLAEGCTRLRVPELGSRDVWVVPGVKYEPSDSKDGSGVEDVMRGEETQLISLGLSSGSQLVVLPGTHNKWALMHEGKLVRFWTFMTGEVFEALRNHTILSKLMPQSGPVKPNPHNISDEFKKGVNHARLAPGGLLHQLFSVRTLGLFNKLQSDELEGYLSGILLGTDIRDALNLPGVSEALKNRVLLVGGEGLCKKYASAFQIFGISTGYLGDTVTKGLQKVAAELEKLPKLPKPTLLTFSPKKQQQHPDSKSVEIKAKMAPSYHNLSHSNSHKRMLINGKIQAHPNLAGNVAAFRQALGKMQLVAILRGIKPSEAVAVGESLVDAGFTIIEVPLNSPQPFESIRRLATSLKGKAVIGAGTVLSPQDVDSVAQAGGTLIVSPNTNPQVIRRTVQLGLVPVPGFQTPSEAFNALESGAHALKLFPAAIPTSATILKGTMAVLPKHTLVLAVGGIKDYDTMAPFWAAGARGFGVGSAVYKPGRSPKQVGIAARECARSLRDAIALHAAGR